MGQRDRRPVLLARLQVTTDFHVRALAGSDRKPLPALLGEQLRKIDDLTDVIGGVCQRSIERLQYRVLFVANENGLEKIPLLQTLQSLQEGAPARFPGSG